MIALTTFADGPAAETTLTLRRIPLFLRVVLNVEGQYDALDQLDDVPHPDECVYAYRVLPKSRGTCHVDRVVDGRRRGEWYVMAKYKMCAIQPLASVLADNEKWGKWCQKQCD